jgi:hypothetical protein
MQNLRCIQVKFLGPTNTRGARVKITENRNSSKDSITLDYSYEIGDGLKQAKKYLQDKGINCTGYTNLGGGLYIILSDSWLKGDDVKFKSII